MGLFLKDENNRSQLQSKIAADLEERLKDRQAINTKEVEPRFNDDSHETRPAGMILIVLITVLIMVLVVWALRLGGIF